MDTSALIIKLQAEAADSLAALCVEAVLDTPSRQWISAQALASIARQALEAWVESPSALDPLEAMVESVVNRLQSERRALKDVLPSELLGAFRQALGRPFSPERRLVLTVIDREPTRVLVRRLLLDAILEFGRRASAPVAGVARGLGSLAKMASDRVKSSGGLGSLMGAVSEEVERQLERRAVEFVDSALGGVFGQLADAVSDPRHAGEAAELRMAFFDGAMELTLPQLGRELANLDIRGGAEVLRSGLKRWLGTAESEAQLATLASLTLGQDAQRPIRELLKQLGLLDITRQVAREQLALRIRSIASTPEFSAWLQAL